MPPNPDTNRNYYTAYSTTHPTCPQPHTTLASSHFLTFAKLHYVPSRKKGTQNATNINNRRDRRIRHCSPNTRPYHRIRQLNPATATLYQTIDGQAPAMQCQQASFSFCLLLLGGEQLYCLLSFVSPQIVFFFPTRHRSHHLGLFAGKACRRSWTKNKSCRVGCESEIWGKKGTKMAGAAAASWLSLPFSFMCSATCFILCM